MKILGIVVIVFVLLAGAVGGYVWYSSNNVSQYYTWELKEGWNEITFSQSQLDASGSDNVEVVFQSIDHDCILNYVFEQGTWLNFCFCVSGNPQANRGGTLQTIQPGTIYHVQVSQDCTLKIPK